MSEVFMPVHDLGCQCWPHVSQRHADAAIVEAARREYVAGRAPDKAVSLQKASPKSGEVSAVSATAPSPASPTAAGRLSDIQKRAEAATPGPWEISRYQHGGGRIFVGRNLIADVHEEGDREFLFAAPADIPALLAIASAALAREQAETALAEHLGAEVSPFTEGWYRQNDRLTAERALAVAALRQSLEVVA